MAADGFASLSHPDTGFDLIDLGNRAPHVQAGRGLQRQEHCADGLLVVFVVEDVDHEYARLQGEGVPITTPLETEPWGERYFQVADPNGVVYQLVQWVAPPPESVTA